MSERLGWFVAATLVVCVGFGCSGPDAADPTGQLVDEPASRSDPAAEGQCRRLTADDIPPPTNDDPVVDCASGATAYTFHVGHWPQRLLKRIDDVEDDRLTTYAGRACEASLGRMFRRSYDTLASATLVSYAWFKPSRAAYEHGADSFRCDVIAEREDRLLRLPADVATRNEVPERFAWCMWSDPRSDATDIRTCDRPHTYRARFVVRVAAADAPFPGETKLGWRVENLCRLRIGLELGNPRSHDPFGWYDPSERQWKQGIREAVCFVSDR